MERVYVIIEGQETHITVADCLTKLTMLAEIDKGGRQCEPWPHRWALNEA